MADQQLVLDSAGLLNTQPGLERPGLFVEQSDDPLSLCLSKFVALNEGNVSLSSLVAGLPMAGARITAPLMVRALQRRGYRAALLKRRLNQLPAIYLPAIIFMGEDDACILLSRKAGKCVIVDPVTGAEQTVSEDHLRHDYSGYCILARMPAKPMDEDQAKATERRGHWFWSAVNKLWPTYGYVAFGAIFINLIALASPLFTMNVYDRVLPNKSIPTLWVLSIGMAVALIFDWILKAMRSWLIDTAGHRADVLLASRIYEHVLAIELGSKPATTGTFASQLKEFESVREFFTSTTVATITDIFFFGIFLVVIYMVGGVMVAVPIVAAVILITLGLIFQFPLKRAAERNSAESAQRHSLLVETIASLETLKAIRAESQMQRVWEGLVGMTAATVERVRGLNSRLANLSSLVQQLVTVGVMLVGSYLFSDGKISTGAIVACVMLSSRAVAPLGSFAMVLARSQQSMVSLKALDKIMSMPVERAAGRNFASDPIKNPVIQFRDVVFGYGASGAPALNGVNLLIRPGEKVGIIGKIGSGKTTIGRLLTRLYQPQQGAILINGIDMNQYHPHDIRRAIGLMGQETDLFNGTVRSNILLANPLATDEKLFAVCRAAGVEDFVKRHPKGFDLPVGERGLALSGGQRQSVALARLLISDPQVIFLDEPSSAMDLASERALIEHLRGSLKPEQTVIVSTHRFSMLDLVDRLIVINNGKIAADGPKAQVLEALRKQQAPATA